MSQNQILLHLTANTPYGAIRKRSFKKYYREATKPEIHAAAAQQGIFQTFMDATIAGELKTKWAMTPDANWDACIHMVEEMMQISNPLMLRRLRVKEIKPTEGEYPRSYIIRSKIAFNKADYEKMTSDNHKALHIIVAMSDPELKTNLLKLAGPITLIKV